MKSTIARSLPLAVMLLFGMSSGALGAVETTGNITYVSKYVWRGWDLAPTDEPAMQGGISVAWPQGWGVDVWGSYAMDNDAQLDELDYTLSYGGRLTSSMDYSVGLTHYTFPSVAGAAENQTESNEGFAGVSWPGAFMSPALTWYEDWEDGSGSYIFLGAGYDFELGAETPAPPLSFSLGVGYNNGQWGNVSGFSDIDLGLSMTFKSGSVDITPAVNYVIIPEDAVNPKNEFWFGLGVDFPL